MRRCARCRGSHLQCTDCEIEDGTTLRARAEAAEAEAARLRAAMASAMLKLEAGDTECTSAWADLEFALRTTSATVKP